jgi:hypothetical protein
MAGNIAKICATQEKSLVEVRRTNAEMLDLRRISVFLGVSERLPGRADGQTCWNRGPDCGIIERLAFRSAVYEVKWQIPAAFFRKTSSLSRISVALGWISFLGYKEIMMTKYWKVG